MKKILTAFILLSSSLIGISGADAVITCPTGTTISTVDSTKCISTTLAYVPTDRTSNFLCPAGSTLTVNNQCLTPGTWVSGGTYQGSPRYVFWCSGGIPPSSDGYCHTPLNPPIVNSQYSPGTTTYLCSTYPYLSLSGTNCYSINNYSSYIPANSTTTYPSCSSGYTRSGDNCTKTIYEILGSPTQYIDGYDCNGTISASQTCTTTGYQTADTYSDPAVSYAGTCSQWLIFSTTTGKCEPYVFSPDTPTQQTIYRCVITGWASVPTISYYNYDASVVAPFGKSITCQATNLTPDPETRDGVYLCSSTNLISGNIYFYASDTDATGVTATVETNCDFNVTEYTNIDDSLEERDYSISDTCDNIPTFAGYMACLASKYV